MDWFLEALRLPFGAYCGIYITITSLVRFVQAQFFAGNINSKGYLTGMGGGCVQCMARTAVHRLPSKVNWSYPSDIPSSVAASISGASASIVEHEAMWHFLCLCPGDHHMHRKVRPVVQCSQSPDLWKRRETLALVSACAAFVMHQLRPVVVHSLLLPKI